ncbi:AT-rich interactive domain-containing protein 3C-like isoform X2 [Lineus longissimus]|uniref:AT-rich interactive domain-containing protein 3C-like isoform X2 n=1 Tax=Lineus longissimus TaxID=88925 RepID=UPI00315CBB5D
MDQCENSLDGSLSNGDMNDMSDVESEGMADSDELERLEVSKMDPAHRVIYEKLKQQEQEERAEIERELKAHKDAINRVHGVPRNGRDINGDSEKDCINPPHELDLRTSNNNRMIHNQIRDLHSPPRRERPVLSHHDIKPDRLPYESIAVGPFFPHSGPVPDRFTRSPAMSEPQIDSDGHHWTFEEQFKQLYELTDDPKRKEFLDDLFAYMQKRGTPVNRIPIMAKQTLDLYELFRLVVSKGGLVEVINRKLWREITKGLNLPSSITSAAFTLRTQYMKYLYPYECEKLKLSSPQELQAAIDGNRREGRRSGYGYDLSPGAPTLVPPPAHHHPPHLNGGILNGKLPPLNSLSDHWLIPGSPNLGDEESLPSPTSRHRSMSERDALAMEAASRAMEEATRKMEAASRAAMEEGGPPRKRPALGGSIQEEAERLMVGVHTGMPSTHLKITSRNDGRSEIDNSLVVSMEINGIMYQGVLFALPPRRL